MMIALCCAFVAGADPVCTDLPDAVKLRGNPYRMVNAMELIRKSHAAASPSDDPLEFVMCDETVDRLGDVIHAKGWMPR